MVRQAVAALGGRIRWQTAAIAALVVCYAILVYRTAWLCDDAFISLRTASNILDGFGPRWNVAERVQAFTHPLWLVALTAAHAVTSEPFYSTLYLSWLVSCAAVICLVFGRPGGHAEVLVGLCLMLCSRSFVDFSTSGLENPLTHLLIALFAVQWLHPTPSDGRYRRLALLAGLAGCNRLDTVALFAPALIAGFPRDRMRGFAALAWGAAPLLAWEAFSVFYYGFPFPNTAYAKLSTGFAGDQHRTLEGARYFLTALEQDPLTLGTMALSLACAAHRKDRPRLWLLCGSALYLGYTFAIGGDFMEGRFLSAPFFVAVACLTSSRWLGHRGAWAVAALAVVAAVASSKPLPWLTGAGYGDLSMLKALNAYGIHDERFAFFLTLSLTNAHVHHPDDRDHPWSGAGHALRARAERDPSDRVQLGAAIGVAGYYAGPDVHMVDRWALADPLLARLPALGGAVGHFTRAVPAGYVESLITGTNRIPDPRLARFYDDLKRVVRGPLLSGERWRAIWNLTTGKHARAVDAYAYVRAHELRPRFRVTNTTGRPNVYVAVGNDGRLQSYWIDDKSVAGKSYEVQWRVTDELAVLEKPFGLPIHTFEGIRARGTLTFGAAFAAADGTQLSMHELRYGYALTESGFAVVRGPWLMVNRAYPTGSWQENTTEGAITPISLTP